MGQEPGDWARTGRRHFLSWRIAAEEGGAARITRPFSAEGATGVALNVRASAPLGDVALGVTEADGSEYEWQLALPCVSRPLDPDGESEAIRRRALWLRMRVPFEWMALSADSEDEDETLDLDQIDELWLRAPKDVGRGLQIDIDDVTLMDVTVHSHAEDRRGAAP